MHKTLETCVIILMKLHSKENWSRKREGEGEGTMEQSLKADEQGFIIELHLGPNLPGRRFLSFFCCAVCKIALVAFES